MGSYVIRETFNIFSQAAAVLAARQLKYNLYAIDDH